MEGAGRDDVLGGRYRLDHLLGRGGMGTVWAGHDLILNRPVAVKMLRDDLGPDTALQRDRLLAEARAAAAVRHPNLVSTFDAISDGDTFALVMERLPGPSLADRLADGPLTATEARLLALDVLGGLDAVHQAGLVHRDVKPANVLRAGDGRWMLVDFGIAKNLLADDHLTVTGTTVGTPAYLAPEQLRGRPAAPTADLWAVGVMLYQALSGRLPFSGDTPFAIAYSVQTDSPEPLSALLPDTDPAIAGTIDRALRKSAEDRFATASAMAASLRPRPAGGAAPASRPAPPPLRRRPADRATSVPAGNVTPVPVDANAPVPAGGVTPVPAGGVTPVPAGGAAPVPGPARTELAAVVDGGPAPGSSRGRALALPLVATSFVLAVVMAVTLGGVGKADTARPTVTSERPPGGDGSPTTAASSPDDATATPPTTAGRQKGSHTTATTPAGPAAEDISAPTSSAAPTPTTEQPETSPPTEPPPPDTTTSTTTSTSTTTTTTPPASIPPVTLPAIPVAVTIGGEPLLPPATD